MKITNVEAGTIVVVVLAVIAAAVQFGRLQGQIEGLDKELIREELDAALGQIVQLRDGSLERMDEALLNERGGIWFDTKDDRKSACVDGAPGVQYCQASNELAYPITVTIVTVNKDRPKETRSRGCGVAIHLVEGTADWYTQRTEGDGDDLLLAHMVTGDRYGVCWAAATVPAGSDYYVVNAYRPHVDIVSWLELH
ncbi:MAG: hypothetical protein OXF27_00190 [Acidobacteria bacterium]|nr:hypothetical protein [Acidobacteriota bacterium]